MGEEKVERSSSLEVNFPEISLKLQQAREAKGVSLRETEAATRIPVYYLQLLEGKGDTRLLSDALYLVPFLRTYALFLGLDPAETTAQFVQVFSNKDDTVSDLGRHPLPLRASAFPTSLIIVLVCLMLLVFLWLLSGDAVISWQ